MKKFLSILCLTVVMAASLTAAAPVPNPSFELVDPTPAELLVLNDPQAPAPTIIMNVGDTITVRAVVTSDEPFVFAQALPNFYYPGRGVMAVQGGAHAARGTTATLEITYVAKGSTAKFPNGAVPVHFVVGARYAGGYTAVKDYLFNVIVP